MFEDMDLLIASALHPHYGLSTLNTMAPELKEQVLQRIVREMSHLVMDENQHEDNSQDMESNIQNEDVLHDPFAELFDRDPPTHQEKENTIEEDTKKELRAWKRSREV